MSQVEIVLSLNQWEFDILVGNLLHGVEHEQAIGHNTCAQNLANIYRQVYDKAEFGVEQMIPPPPLPYKAVTGMGR